MFFGGVGEVHTIKMNMNNFQQHYLSINGTLKGTNRLDMGIMTMKVYSTLLRSPSDAV